MKRKSFISRLIHWFQLLLICCLILAYFAPHISPEFFWPLSFFGLLLPYLLLLNILLLIYWGLKGKKMFFLLLVVLALGYQNTAALFQLKFGKTEIEPEFQSKKPLKIMSFNVRVFDLYLWSKEKETRNKIFDFLKREDPDVLCLQEFYHRDQQNPSYEFKTLDTLVKFLSAKNYHFFKTTTLRENDHWGIITFSKYPILKKSWIDFPESTDNGCIYTDLLFGGDTIRIYNGHLASIKLDKHDYKAIKKINKNKYSSNFGKERLIFNKLKHSFIRRAPQVDAVGKSIASSPYPTIFCGDLNDTPSSYAYNKVKGKLNDAFIQSGSGLGQTYIGDFPSFRIDYIFYDQHFLSADYTTHPEKLSDHHPVSAKLYFKKE